MKRNFCILIVFIASIGFAACGGESAKDDATDASVQATQPIVAQTTESIATPASESAEPPITPEGIDIDEVKTYLNENYNKVNIDGSTSMVPLHESLNNLFGAEQENIEHSKTVDAFEKLISGENDILLGVDYSDELLEKAENSGVKLVKKEITREAFIFLINESNPVKNLTIDQIKDIYSGKITNWSEVGGDDAPIKAFQRNEDSGSQIRMNKFMADTPLMEKNVEYISSMGYIIEQVGDYYIGQYSIAYNMYTFSEKQYTGYDIALLNINGIEPDDESIFNDSYPINIYNYIYYDENNTFASEFAENLFIYLMSDEGQKLISDSGYVNIHENHERNMDIYKPYEEDYSRGLGFYNEETGEFYDVEYDDEWVGKLLVFTSFNDFVLRDSEYKNHPGANKFLTAIFNSEIDKNPHTAWLFEEEGSIILTPWSDGSLDPEDFFNYRYNELYYSELKYYIDEDKYILSTYSDKESYNYYMESGYLEEFSKYTNDYALDMTLEITEDELENLYLRDYGVVTPENVELNYFQPFKN